MAERFDYKGYHGCESHCLIDLYRHPNDLTVVVATEPDYDVEDSGTSVTNAAEHIATEVCKQYNIPMLKLVFIEHYDYQSFHSRGREETWDLVTFTRERAPVRGHWDYPRGEMVFTTAKWQPLSVEQKDRLIAGDLSVFKELKAPVCNNFFENAFSERT